MQFDLNTLLVSLALCCVLPTLLLIGLSVWVLQHGAAWLTPDEGKLRAEFDRIRATQPNTPLDKLVQQMIQSQALKAGIAGAITSVGGLPFLPLGLVVDLVASSRIQNSMLHFIGWSYASGATPRAAKVLALPEAIRLRGDGAARNLLLEGGQAAARMAQRRIMLIVAEKAAAKLVPILGLVVGFAVNYLTTRAIGQAAAVWYRRTDDR
jgi:hypothetical protein